MSSISVIIPTFNRASQVCEAVKSVMAQSELPLEIIVVDDGSTDNTEQLLAPLSKEIRYVKTENRGVSAARNRGIRESQGEWIAFLDSDDLWHPDKLRRQLRNIEQTGSKVCFCVSLDETGERMDDLHAMDAALTFGADQYYGPGDYRLFKFPRHPFLQSMLVEKGALLICGNFDETLTVAEDTKLIYCLAMRYGYSVVNEGLTTICQERTVAGLSDSMDSESAYIRHSCYIRVQSEAYWRLLDVDQEVATILKRNLIYFASRQAEIACALDMKEAAKQYALTGLTFHGTWKTLCRSMFVLMAYPVAQKRYDRKWNC